MKKYILKLVVLLLILNTIVANNSFAGTIIYEDKKTEIVSEGVVRDDIRRLTSEGWLSFNVLHVDLTNPYIKLDTIFSKQGISSRTTVLNMANQWNSIAAINGDFFSPKPGTTQAHAMGPVINNGQLITTPADESDKDIFGVFALNSKNVPYYLYWSKNITLIAPNYKMMKISDINKFGWYTNLYMYDSNWGPKTVGKSDTFPTLTQMVVENNIVTNIISDEGPIDIPKNGYVICGDYEAGEFLKSNFSIGSAVKVSSRTTPDWQSMRTAIGGGTFLVRDGKVATFSHDLPGLHPRTAIGTTKDNKEAMLVTVDGRQLSSNGLTQTGFANLLIELGVYNALNLDGGGSTTMVSRDLGQNAVKIINSVSETTPRSVTNSIGVFTSAPKGKLKGMKITTTDANIFTNTSRKFEVLGYDDHYNPININMNEIAWSTNGINGSFTDNKFRPTSSGQGEVIASIGNIKASIKVHVLDNPVELTVLPADFKLTSSPKEIRLFAKDKYGYKAEVNLEDVKIIPSTAVDISGNKISLKNNRYNFIRLSLGSVYTYVGKETAVSSNLSVFDGFEKANNAFWGYPATVKGSYSLSNTIKKSGNSSGKLEFDFTNGEGTQGAYIKLNNNGYTINSAPSKISLWVYSATKSQNEIKAEFNDANGSVFRTTLASSIDWTDWKELQTKIPDNIQYPVTLRKVYVVQTANETQKKGELYFDDLNIYYESVSTTPSFRVPNPKILKDFQQVEPQTNVNDAANIAVFTNPSVSTNDKYNFAVFLNADSQKVKSNDLNSFVNTKKFDKKEYNNSLFISLSGGQNKSIRKTDYTQWISLFNTLAQNKKQNVFVVIDTPINSFTDHLEANLLKKTLSDYAKQNKKNVWVIFEGAQTNALNEDGVKYISIENTSSSKYLNIITNDNTLKYSFNNIQ